MNSKQKDILKQLAQIGEVVYVKKDGSRVLLTSMTNSLQEKTPSVLLLLMSSPLLGQTGVCCLVRTYIKGESNERIS